MLDEINQQLNQFYSSNLAHHGMGAKGVGWKDEQAQLVRFEQLAKLLPASGTFVVNDLGCGTGAFLPFLQSRFSSFQYQGYDVIEDMLVLARTSNAGTSHKFLHIQQADEMAPADFTVASGIFNIRYSISDEQWQSYILKTLEAMNVKSSKGFAFNALTSYSDPEFMKPELFYSDPLFVFDWCKKHFSKNVALLHDYFQYDFTILVRK